MATKRAALDLVVSIYSALKACQVLANQGTLEGFKAKARYKDINDHKCMR